MLPALIEYFAWGLLLAVVTTSVVIVYRELRSIIRDGNEHEAQRRRQPR